MDGTPSREMELEQIRALNNMQTAQIAKLTAETAKLDTEVRWYPFVVVGGLFAAVIAIGKLFFS